MARAKRKTVRCIDNCYDLCHASGLFVVAEGKLSSSFWAHLIAAERIHGEDKPSVSCKEPVTRSGDCLVFTQRHHETQKKPKSSDLQYPSYQRPAPSALPCLSCPPSCLLGFVDRILWLFASTDSH